MSPFFSIIVPVYNAEETIGKCINSILLQDYSSFEVLLIDDGSSDNSLEICEDLGRKDGRIIVSHQENQGVSSARNNGINMAKGTYLFFIDSDDYIEIDTLAKIHDTVKKKTIDVCFFGYYCLTNGKVEKTVLPSAFIGKKNSDVLLALIESNTFGLACNKVIRNELIKKNALCFDHEIKIFEDQDMMMTVWNCASEICCIVCPFYYYICNQKSAMQSFQSAQVENYFLLHDVNLKKLSGFMLENGITQEKVDAYAFYYVSSEIGNIVRLSGIGCRKDFKTFMELLQQSELMKAYNSFYFKSANKKMKDKLFRLLTKKHLSFLMRWIGKIARR